MRLFGFVQNDSTQGIRLFWRCCDCDWRRVTYGWCEPLPYASLPVQLTYLIGEIGNGRAAAILLARHGAKVALVDYNVEWANETKRMIDEENGTSIVVQADVTDETSCKNAVAKTVEEWGAVHILINIGKCCFLASLETNEFPNKKLIRI